MELHQSDFQTTLYLADVRPLENRDLYLRVYSLVSSERQRDADEKRQVSDKCLSLAGGFLLDRLVEKVLLRSPGGDLITEPPIQAFQVTHTPEGRPIVSGHPEIYLSLTHSYPYVSALISPLPCGVDLETRNRDLQKIAERWYFPAEREAAGQDPAKLTDIWCRKECLVKAGLSDSVPSGDTLTVKAPWHFVSFPLQDFSFEVLMQEDACALKTIDLFKP